MLEEICIRKRAGRKFEPGSTLNHRWTIVSSFSENVSRISDGSSNRRVKLVQDISTGKWGILKMLTPDIVYPDHAMREICVLQNLTRLAEEGQTDIVRLLDFDDGSQHPHDIPWMLMELCDRGTLAQLVKDYSNKGMHLPEAFLWHVLEQLATSVQFCHSTGVLHRDITPANVFLQTNPEAHTYPHVRLGDFGCAFNEHDWTQMTLATLSPGNPSFMPPEGYTVEASCDIYQVGLVILCLCMGEVDPTESLADFYTDGRKISPELNHLLAWCLAAEATQRPSAEMLIASIQRIIAAGGKGGRAWIHESLLGAENGILACQSAPQMMQARG